MEMVRLKATKTSLYRLVAEYVDNLPPMRSGTQFIKYPRRPDYAMDWITPEWDTGHARPAGSGGQAVAGPVREDHLRQVRPPAVRPALRGQAEVFHGRRRKEVSQRKAKEYRRAMDQYKGVVEDVDDLKRRIGAMEARHRREDLAAEAKKRREAARMWANLQAENAAAERAAEEQKKVERHKRNERRRRELARRRIITLACAAVLLLAIVWAIATACTAQENEPGKEATAVDPVVFVTPTIGEDPMEAEKIEEALLAQGYLSDAVPLSYDLQDIMRTACEEYGCPYPLALAVAEVESHFDMDAVGSAGEVGIMQLNPGPENTYWINLEAETNQDPTTPAGNIVCGVYLLGAHLVNYGDTEKAVMAYNMGNAGAERAWENGVTSTEHSEKVMEAMARWEAVVG